MNFFAQIGEAPVTRHEFAGGFAQLAAEGGLRKVAT